MPAIYASTIYAQPGQEETVAALYRELAEQLRDAPGYRGRHVLRAHHPDHTTHAIHFISIEIWESAEARAAHRATDAFKAWYDRFKVNLLPEHTHGYYDDIGRDH
ncbi:MAG: antibiotic biosynthesis monooxygenase [Dehalococcoidia bacterium]|nr:antibiotic biosynthesis monooxygenase [Dehalococcoidia bacterium]